MMTKQQSQEIWGLIKDTKVAMLTTQDDGVMRSRPMHHVQGEFDGTLWFFTAKSSGKIEELQRKKQVCLSYADPSNGAYVSLSGDVGFTDDKALIDKFWNGFVSAWFPEGKDDGFSCSAFIGQKRCGSNKRSNARTILFISAYNFIPNS